MKKRYIGIISSINDIKDRIIYDWMSAKESEREYRNERDTYRERRYSVYQQETTTKHYRYLEEIASEHMWMEIGRQISARSLWDTIKRSEELSPPEPQSPEDFDFSHIPEEDIPFSKEGDI